MTRYFVATDGSYIGGFCENSPAPDGGIEVGVQPPDGRAIWDGNAWAMPIELARSDAIKSMATWIDGFLSRFTSKYPRHERDAWPLLALAAKAHLAGTPQQMILTEAAIVGRPPDDVASVIVEKSEMLASIIDHTRGLRQVTEAAIMAAASPEEVWAALTIAQGQALDMLDAIVNPSPAEL